MLKMFQENVFYNKNVPLFPRLVSSADDKTGILMAEVGATAAEAFATAGVIAAELWKRLATLKIELANFILFLY